VIQWDTQSTFEHVRSVADLALDLVAGPAVAQALAVAQEAARGPVVAAVQDLDRVAAVEAAQERDQGPEAVRDLEQVQVLVAGPVQALAMDRDLEVDRGPAADTVAARAQDLAPAGSLAMASAFTSGTTLSKSGRSYTRLAP
jgi:hypothetical protein